MLTESVTFSRTAVPRGRPESTAPSSNVISLRSLPLVVLFVLAGCSPGASLTTGAEPDYLYLWTASADSTQPDFLAVLDVTEDAGRYGRLVTTLPVPGLRNGPHH